MKKKSEWILIDIATGKEVHVGDFVITFRGELVTLVGLQPPYSPGTEGKVFCVDRNRRDNVYYATVVGARFERRMS
jgi:hypothetical protein